jgi:hypothetical protein
MSAVGAPGQEVAWVERRVLCGSKTELKQLTCAFACGLSSCGWQFRGLVRVRMCYLDWPDRAVLAGLARLLPVDCQPLVRARRELGAAL